MAIKTLYIDADHLIYKTIYSPMFVDKIDGEVLNPPPLKDFKDMFKSLLDEVVTTCQLETVMGEMIKFEGFVCCFTGNTNFRYDIFEDYKKSRADRDKPEMFYKLKSWAAKKYGIISDLVEADDIVCYYSRKGHPIVSADKDVLKGTPGYHWNNHAKKFVNVTVEEANEFRILQCVHGDLGDDIPGIRHPEDKEPITKTSLNGTGVKTIGPVSAKKLLDGKYNLDQVISIYKKFNFTLDYALIQIRLVDVDPIKKISKKGKITLFKFNKSLDKV